MPDDGSDPTADGGSEPTADGGNRSPGPEEGSDDRVGPAGYRLPEPAWPVRESVVEYDTPWYTGGYDLVEQPDGSTKRYYWAALRPAVVVVAVTDGTAVCVRQYRPTIRQHQLELVAGIVEPGESPTTAAARELREEAGFDPSGTAVLQDVWVATGVLRHRRVYVYADGLTPVERSLDDNEYLEVEAVPTDEVLARAREQPTNDATVQGLLLAREEGLLD